MPETYAFSTGKIRFGAPGAVLTDADNVAAVEDVTFTFKEAEALVREAAQISKYPVANAFYDADVMIQFSTKSFHHPIVPYLSGATHTVSGGYDVYTGGATDSPQPMQLVFIGQTDQGKSIEIDLPRGFGMQVPLTFKRADFAGMQVQVASRPNATYPNPYILKVQQ